MLRISGNSRCSSSISLRISQRVNPVRNAAMNVENRFKTKYSEKSFGECLRMALGVSIVGFVVTTGMWMMEEKSTISGWRFLAHLGPYQIPSLMKSGRWKRALDELGEANNDDDHHQLSLTESEISQLLTDIEVITQRRQAVREIVQKYGFEIFLPVLKNLSFQNISGQSHFESNLRIVMDILSATRASDRQVPISVIEELVTRNNHCWDSKSNEEVERFPEYRALILLKLVQNESNANRAKQSGIIQEFVNQEWAKSYHVKFSSLPLIPFLYQFKTEKLGYEYADILWRIKKCIGRADEVEAIGGRISLKLEYKLDFQNFEKMIYLAICYSSLRYIPLISEYSFPVLKHAVLGMMKSVLGAIILDMIYRAEEHVIQSKPYFDIKHPLIGGSGMVCVNALVGGLVLRYLPFSFAPFLLMKVRDSFTDSFRFI